MSRLPKNSVITGDCFDVLERLPANSIDASVTDPPYNYEGGFMGVEWDDIGTSKEYQKWCQKWAEKVLRVLKPGGYLIATSSNKMHHRLFSGVEDTGFDILGLYPWLYGGGFPKSTNVSRKIDEKLGVADEREVVAREIETSGWTAQNQKNAEKGYRPNPYYDDEPDVIERERPASMEAQRFDGFGTNLKPAAEFAVVARKPPTDSPDADTSVVRTSKRDEEWSTDNRCPNAAIDKAVAEMADSHHEIDGNGASQQDVNVGTDIIGDVEDTDKFFYTSKASTAERTLDGRIENDHVAVKPLDLMEYYIDVVAEPGDIILDHFCGTGTTLWAAKNHGCDFIGIEADEKTADTARVRAGLEPEDPSHITEDGQQHLGNFT